MTDLQTLQAQLAQVTKQIKAEKAMVKLQACKLTQRTSAKYFDLQRAYMESLKG
jgi:hypothetical protein